MKCVVIAAGYATRLGELTRNFPKPLLKIGENTILGRMLDDIDRIPEIDEHIIITNHKFAPIFEEWVKANTDLTDNTDKNKSVQSESSVVRYKKPITIIDDGTETNDTRLGAVCDLLLAIDYLDKKSPLSGVLGAATTPFPSGKGHEAATTPSPSGRVHGAATTPSPSGRVHGAATTPSPSGEGPNEADLLVVAADNLLFFSFREFVDFAKAKGTSCIMCHEQPSIEKLQRTGVVELDENHRVLGMEEKPEHPKSHWAVPPFYIYRKEDLDLVRHSVENGCGKDAPGNLAHYMVEHTTMHAWPMSAGRFDIGSLDTYYEACELAKAGKI